MNVHRSLVNTVFAVLAVLAILTFGRAAQATSDQPAGAPAPDWSSPADLSNPRTWRLAPSDGVSASVNADEGGVRLDVDFASGAGFVVLSHDVAMDLPDNYQFAFDVKGRLPDNNLEFKIIDQPAGAPANGENVWWVNRRAFTFPSDWATLRSRARHFSFAWGPSGGAKLKTLKRIEFAIASNKGGKGSVWLRDLRFRPLPSAPPTNTPPVATATSQLDNQHGPGGPLTDYPVSWRSSEGATEAAYTISYDALREVGGLLIAWDSDRFARDYEVQLSDDGQEFVSARHMRRADGGEDYLPLPDTEAKVIRIVMRDPATPEGFGIGVVRVFGPEFAATPNAFFSHVARRTARGSFPRMFLGEQAYWTVVGACNYAHESLINEDGCVEPFKQGFSIEPFVHVDSELKTWNDGTCTARLTDEVLPLPEVRRDFDGLSLTVTAWVADGQEPSVKPGSPVLYIRYRVSNTRAREVRGSLLLALRPFQVVPPWQSLNFEGGFAPIRSTAYSSGVITINEEHSVVMIATPGGTPQFGALTSDQGEIIEWLRSDRVPADQSVLDPTGMASGAVRLPISLAAGASSDFMLAVSLSADAPGGMAMLESMRGEQGAQRAAAALKHTRDAWSEVLVNRIHIDLPEAGGGRDLADTLRAQVGYILINRDGPAIQPGSRTYERSWIRDGSMTSSALLQLGFTDEARRFIEWYAPFQFESGKVPCVVDARGPDPVPEHDSHGQLIWAIVNYTRITGDEAFLRAQYAHIQRAVQYIRDLRATRMTAEFTGDGTRQEPGKPPVSARAFFGLLPESISHEGYSAKPMHSYWDDLFASRGLHDAAWAGARLGEQTDAAEYRALADAFDRDLSASIAATMKAHGIDYIPGCVELGDYDATSTSVALYPTQFAPRLPGDALRRTFESYVRHVRERASSPSDYTPYEWRNVGAMIRLGMKNEAWEVTSALMKDRRPRGWRHWAEVVRKGYRDPAFIGDMPHTWCGSDFVNSVLSMLLYEDADGAQVVFAGLPEAMARSLTGASFTDLHTSVGLISASAASTTCGLRVQVQGTLREGASLNMLVCSPGDTPPKSATLNGQSAALVDGRVRVTSLPADVVFQH